MPKRTKGGKMTAVGDVESKLKHEYGSGKEAAGKVFGTLNKIGLMRGNKTTKKGMKRAGSGKSSRMRDMAMLKRQRME